MQSKTAKLNIYQQCVYLVHTFYFISLINYLINIMKSRFPISIYMIFDYTYKLLS